MRQTCEFAMLNNVRNLRGNEYTDTQITASAHLCGCKVTAFQWNKQITYCQKTRLRLNSRVRKRLSSLYRNCPACFNLFFGNKGWYEKFVVKRSSVEILALVIGE